MSSEELKHGMSDNTETGSNDDHGFSDWVESITATQDALKTLVAHPDYSLYQAKEHMGEGNMAIRPASGVLSLFSLFQAHCNRGWKKLIKTLTETGDHNHLRGVPIYLDSQASVENRKFAGYFLSSFPRKRGIQWPLKINRFRLKPASRPWPE